MDFETLNKNFTDALLAPQAAVPNGLVAVRAPNIQKRFGVYRNNVMASLIESLKSNFPIAYALVGDNFFKALAVSYISQNPPNIPMLFEYGSEFPDFIAEYEAAAGLPYLADIAQLEIQWRQAYHCLDVEPLDISSMQEIAPEDHMQMTFKFHPSVSILKSGWPIFSIWQGHENGNMNGVDLEQSENILIARPNVEVLIINLNMAACGFFRDMMNKNTLGIAYERALELDGDFDLNKCFGQLFGVGLVVELNVE